MKQKLLNSIKLRVAMLVAVMCAVFTGQTWATPSTIASLINSTTTGWTISGATSTGSGTGLYWLLTSSSNTITSPSINWDDYTNLTIKIKARTYGGPSAAQAKISVKQASTELTSYTPDSKTLTYSSELEITPSGTSSLVIACLGASSSKGSGVSEIIIKGELASTGEATTVTIDASGINNNLFGSNTDGGSLSATVLDSSDKAVGGASVTWSSNNSSVATINSSTGVVTLVAVGSTTITASYAGDEDYRSSSNTYVLKVINRDPDLETIWSEDFGDYSADDVPDGGTYSYACTNGGGTTRIFEEGNSGGTSPELLIGKSSGTFSATIPLLYPTYGYSGDLTLTFKSNAYGINVKTTTKDITVDGEASEGAGLTFDTKDTHTVTFEGVTTSTENITIVFTTTTSSNVRIDDIVLEGKQAALTKVATPAISPASGAVVSGSEVTITCPTEGATIYYTMGADPADPTSSSTAYNSASKPTITSATTIKAIAIKDGLTNSSVASASYTIALPCATPTFSVAEGVVDKGTSVSITTGTAGATIYYTTNGSTPTTSSSVYSSALTINASQTIKAIAVKDGMANSEVASATYTVRDFANLPFSWDNTSTQTGITNSGVGTYADSPYQKFDGTGDYLILKLNDAPGELKYDIKGNGFSGGTFKVQYSADGSSYTDLKSYTELGDKTTETFTSIPATTRYIKWVYTTKSSGNVALGNFKLQGCESVTVGTAGYTTYTTTGKVSFPSGVKGYIATATHTSTVTLTEVTTVPAEKPIVVEAAAGTYYLPVVTTAADDVSGNLLEASDGSVKGGAGIYALGVGKTGANKDKVGFYLVDSSVTIPAGKAYLDLSGSPVKEFLTFDFDGETAINSLTPYATLSTKGEEIYNLAGQRLNRLQKGVNIVNGKKVLVK